MEQSDLPSVYSFSHYSFRFWLETGSKSVVSTTSYVAAALVTVFIALNSYHTAKKITCKMAAFLRKSTSFSKELKAWVGTSYVTRRITMNTCPTTQQHMTWCITGKWGEQTARINRKEDGNQLETTSGFLKGTMHCHMLASVSDFRPE